MVNKIKLYKSKRQRKVPCILLALTFTTVAFCSAQAGSQKLVPDDTIGIGSTRWNAIPACGAGNCWVTYVTDGVDGNYLSNNASLVQVWSFTNTSGIPGTAVVDSYGVWLRSATNNTAGSDRILPRIRSTGTANFCDGAVMNIETTTFADSVRRFTTWPTGAGTCTGGVLSTARMDSLQLQIQRSVGDSLKVTECSVVVWYTEAGGAIKGRKRRMSDEGGYEKIAEYCQLDLNWVIGFREPEFLWREEE